MRTKEEIIKTATNKRYWTDADVSRKAHQTDILIEVLIDIRDQILDTKCMLTYLLDDDVKQAFIKAGIL